MCERSLTLSQMRQTDTASHSNHTLPDEYSYSVTNKMIGYEPQEAIVSTGSTWHTLDIVQQDVLEEDDGVVAFNGRLEQGLGVGHSGAGNQLHTRNTLEVAFKPLAVLSAQLPPHTSWAPDHNWHLQ